MYTRISITSAEGSERAPRAAERIMVAGTADCLIRSIIRDKDLRSARRCQCVFPTCQLTGQVRAAGAHNHAQIPQSVASTRHIETRPREPGNTTMSLLCRRENG